MLRLQLLRLQLLRFLKSRKSNLLPLKLTMADPSTKLTTGSADQFLDTVKSRRSIYALTSESTVPDSRIGEIVEFAILHAPSAYNIQSARALILFKDDHLKLWDIVKKHMSKTLEGHPKMSVVLDRISKFRGSHGTVLWFEDEVAVKGITDRNPMAQHMAAECKEALWRKGRMITC